MTGAVAAINCTNCGAGLEVLGGGRVTTQVCGYCGAALDSNNNYRVLKVYANMERPPTPFRLGMVGEVEGVPFTIIGILGQVERYEGKTWRWVDHMLYSPTHGYAWITLEDGHTVLTRKTRDWPSGSFLTAAAVERAESRPTRNWRGKTYTYYATSTWTTEFAEGEFNWRARVGETGTSVSTMPKGLASDKLTFVQRPEGERELEVSRYFPEAAQVFGAEPPLPSGVHPLQPYVPSPSKGFYKRWFGGLTLVAGAAMLFFFTAGDSRVVLHRGLAAEVPPEFTFDVSDTTRPVRIQLRHGLSQAWAEWAVEVQDPTGAPLAETMRGISYYSGGSGDESWSEGSRFADVTFRPTTAGTYRLKLDMAASATPAQAQQTLDVTVREGLTNGLWMAIVAACFALAFLAVSSSHLMHRARRWSGSDWSEDDD
ncbi:MAG: DUF4178 domain-containing protein [Pseudomonadota bacterium]